MNYKNILENQIKELERLNRDLVKRSESADAAYQVALTIKELVETVNSNNLKISEMTVSKIVS